jgi:CheY-like chemotaxis protein
MIDELSVESNPREDLLPASGINVLVADLHRCIADTLVMILNHCGFSAFPADSASEAFRIASEKPIDVAFIELLIGETNGIDAARRILALRPHCRIVIWCGRSEPELSWVRREAEEQFGGCALLLKPIWPEDVMRIARGEPIPVEYSIPSEWWNAIKAPTYEDEYPSGSQLYEYLSQQRALLRRLMGEKNSPEDAILLDRMLRPNASDAA